MAGPAVTLAQSRLSDAQVVKLPLRNAPRVLSARLLGVPAVPTPSLVQVSRPIPTPPPASRTAESAKNAAELSPAPDTAAGRILETQVKGILEDGTCFPGNDLSVPQISHRVALHTQACIVLNVLNVVLVHLLPLTYWGTGLSFVSLREASNPDTLLPMLDSESLFLKGVSLKGLAVAN